MRQLVVTLEDKAFEDLMASGLDPGDALSLIAGAYVALPKRTNIRMFKNLADAISSYRKYVIAIDQMIERRDRLNQSIDKAITERDRLEDLIKVSTNTWKTKAKKEQLKDLTCELNDLIAIYKDYPPPDLLRAIEDVVGKLESLNVGFDLETHLIGLGINLLPDTHKN